MPPRLREDKRRATLLATPQLLELHSGPTFLRRFDGRLLFRSSFDDERDRRAAYFARRADVMENAERLPGGRPWAWWRYEASDAEVRALHASPDEHERAFAVRLSEEAAEVEFVGTEARRIF